MKRPKLSLEQYSIGGDLAAEVLMQARLSGDIEGKVVFDLGCGSGRLAIGAALMGAKLAVGVDVDEECLKIAQCNAERVASNLPVCWVRQDIQRLQAKCDTVVQNPPFGMRGQQSDLLFLHKALQCAPKVYSLHHSSAENRRFLQALLRKWKAKILFVKTYQFLIPHTFKFHRKPKYRMEVDLYGIESGKGV